MANGDATAVEKGLRELAVPFFHHEFVRQAIMQALHSADSESCMLSLLGQLSECGLVSSNQLAKVISPPSWPTHCTSHCRQCLRRQVLCAERAGAASRGWPGVSHQAAQGLKHLLT